MTRRRPLLLAVVLASACTGAREPESSAPPREPPLQQPTTPPQVPTDPNGAVAAQTCKLPLEDAQSRQRSGDVVRTIDLDGDGRTDTFVRACHGGNCDYLLYLEQTPCARYVGMIQGSITDDPSCVAPPSGQPCTISMMRFMIHGDMQEYLFAFDANTGEYAEAGYGERYVDPPPDGLR